MGTAFLDAGEEGEDAEEVGGDGGVVAAEVSAEFEVFLDGHVGEDAAAFGDVGNAEGDDAVRRGVVEGDLRFEI